MLIIMFMSIIIKNNLNFIVVINFSLQSFVLFVLYWSY